MEMELSEIQKMIADAELQFHRLRHQKEQSKLQLDLLDVQIAQLQGRHAAFVEVAAAMQKKAAESAAKVAKEPVVDAPGSGAAVN